LNAVIVFVKNPELGKVKTRLASTIGAEYALKVYSALLRHTQQILISVPAHIRVYFSERLEQNQGWRSNECSLVVQRGNHLGERLNNAFLETFQLGYEKVVVIGSDCLEITSDHLTSSFEVLSNNDMVIGPTYDGGYYLLGMKQVYPQLFANKSWSTPDVYTQTLQDFEHIPASWQALETLNDIDTYEDVIRSPLKMLLNTYPS
jgi:rSAM/selenodomain-associated transferase 1